MTNSAIYQGKTYQLIEQTPGQAASADPCRGCAFNDSNWLCGVGADTQFDACVNTMDHVWKEVNNEKEA